MSVLRVSNADLCRDTIWLDEFLRPEHYFLSFYIDYWGSLGVEISWYISGSQRHWSKSKTISFGKFLDIS